MNQHVHNMVWGALVGYAAGLARRGDSSYRSFNWYEPTPIGMAPSEDFDAWLLWTGHLGQGKSAVEVPRTRASCFRSSRIESAFAQVNLDAGLSAPMSGSFRNPVALSADGWTRSWLWGIALPSHDAATFAYWDTLCDQATDSGVIVATLCAAMRASGPVEWVRLTLGLLDRVPAARNTVRFVMNGIAAGESIPSIHKALPSLAETDDPLSSTLNLGYITLAILGGAGSFESSLGHAVACGGASHSVAAYVGAMVAKWAGAVPEKWLAPLGTDYMPSGRFELTSVPTTIDDFVQGIPSPPPSPEPDQTPAPQDVLPVEDPSTGYEAEVVAQTPPPLPAPPVLVRPVDIPVTTSKSSVYALNGAVVTVQYEDPPIVHGDRSIQCIVTFEGVGEEVLVSPTVVAPDGWQIAHRLVPFRLVKGSKHSFPLVLQPTPEGGHVTIQCLGGEVRIVAFASQQWALCGPFPNHDGTAYEKVFKCEDVLTTTEVFAGRSGGVRWQQKTFAGIGYDVESYFAGVTGACYFYGDFEFESPGQYRVVAACSPGVVVKVNRETVIKYNHTHQPNPRPMLPYVGTFVTSGRYQVLVKLVRGNEPMAPLTLYFLNDAGEVVFPVRHTPMPA